MPNFDTDGDVGCSGQKPKDDLNMNKQKILPYVLAAASALLLPLTPGWSDVIPGEWCPPIEGNCNQPCARHGIYVTKVDQYGANSTYQCVALTPPTKKPACHTHYQICGYKHYYWTEDDCSQGGEGIKILGGYIPECKESPHSPWQKPTLTCPQNSCNPNFKPK